MKKILAIVLLLTILISTLSTVSAAETKTNLNIVQKESEQKLLNQGDSYYTNKIVSIDSKEGIVEMELTIDNISTDKNVHENTEIFILVSENIVVDSTEFAKYVSYIEEFSKNIFNNISNAKIGIVGIKGTISDITENPDGTFTIGPNDEGTVKGSDSNAEIVVPLTNELNKITSGINSMNLLKTVYKTNLQAAIKLTNNSFSNDVNKILISLYDNVPSIANGVSSKITYGGLLSQYATVEEAVIGKNTNIVRNTKAEILNLRNNNVDFFLLRPDDTSFDQTWFNTTTGEVTLEFDGSPYVKELYGTTDSPTYGTMYSLNNENLEKIVTENIYNEVVNKIGAVLSNTKVDIHFTDEILDNFDLIIENEKVDKSKLKDHSYISWDTGDIESLKTAVLKYSLKIKNMDNKDILDKELKINDKVELTYTNYLDSDKTISLITHPSVKLVEIKDKDTNKLLKDETPATGTNLSILYRILDILFK